MLNLMKADIYRMTKSKGLLIFWLSVIAMLSITVFTKDSFALGAMPMTGTMTDGMKLDVSQLFYSSNFYYLLMIPVYSIIVAEFSEKTVKNTISSSITKKLYYVSKFILAQVYCIASFVVSNMGFYAVNRFVNGTEYSSDFGKFMGYVGWQCFVVFFIVSILTAAAFLFAKGAVFNSVMIMSPIVLSLIERLLYSIKSTQRFTEDIIIKYDFNTIFAKLASGISYKEIHTYLTFISAVSTAVFCIGIMVFRKKEIK